MVQACGSTRWHCKGASQEPFAVWGTPGFRSRLEIQDWLNGFVLTALSILCGRRKKVGCYGSVVRSSCIRILKLIQPFKLLVISLLDFFRCELVLRRHDWFPWNLSGHFRSWCYPPWLILEHGGIQAEWRGIGVQQSRGWVHYAIHRPEPHIMLFRRPLNYQQNQQQPAGAVQSLGMKAWFTLPLRKKFISVFCFISTIKHPCIWLHSRYSRNSWITLLELVVLSGSSVLPWMIRE